MSSTEMLTAMAEISVAFAGFGGLIAIFVGRRPDAPRLADFPQFWFMIELSLLTLFAAIVPLLVVELYPEGLWSASNVFLALVLTGYGLRIVRERNATPTEQRLPGAYVAVVYGISAAAVLGLFVNGVGLISKPQAWPYLATLIWLLLGIAVNYLRFLRVLASNVR